MIAEKVIPAVYNWLDEVELKTGGQLPQPTNETRHAPEQSVKSRKDRHT